MIAEKQLMTMFETTLPGGREADTFARWRKWGKGEVIAVFTFPQRRTQLIFAPPALRDYMTRFIELTELPRNGYFRLDGEIPADNHKQLLGRGGPEVEVVVREKDNGDRFVFVLNCGGAGSGTVVLPRAAGQVVDALNDEAQVPFRNVDDGIEIPVKLAPWGYRVLRVTAK